MNNHIVDNNVVDDPVGGWKGNSDQSGSAVGNPSHDWCCGVLRLIGGRQLVRRSQGLSLQGREEACTKNDFLPLLQFSVATHRLQNSLNSCQGNVTKFFTCEEHQIAS